MGVLGCPLLGTLQDMSLDRSLRHASPPLHAALADPVERKFGLSFQPLDKAKIGSLSGPEKVRVDKVIADANQAMLARIAILPSILFVGFLGLGVFFLRRGGYRPVEVRPSRPRDES